MASVLRLFFFLPAAAFAASILVLGMADSPGFDTASILWRSALIALLATLATLLVFRVESGLSRAPVRPPEAVTETGPTLPAERESTIKLLELIALGDRYGNRFSIALVTVDHLDEIVRDYSEDAAHRLLQGVADTLTETVRMPDRVGRFDRNRFLVVLPETGIQGAQRIGERLREAVAGVEFTIDERVRIWSTVSVGITAYRRGDDLQALVSRAEKAMVQAQNQGRNRVLSDIAA